MTFNGNWGKADGETRTEEYRKWRTLLGCGAVADVDQIEYVAATGRPALLVELCVADRCSTDYPAGVRGTEPSPRFFEQVERKVSTDRPQGRCLRRVGQALDVPCVLVVYIKDELDAGVWVKRTDGSRAWERFTLAEFERRLRRLHQRAAEITEGPTTT